MFVRLILDNILMNHFCFELKKKSNFVSVLFPVIYPQESAKVNGVNDCRTKKRFN